MPEQIKITATICKHILYDKQMLHALAKMYDAMNLWIRYCGHLELDSSECETHTCQVVRKSKSETVCTPMIFVYNLVIEHVEKSGAQVLRVRLFSLFKQT